jgi:radical SAM protein (TIGR01212 family)
MESNWNGLPFNPISQFYSKKFGEKVYKIPVSIVDTCPNRLGLKGMQTCVFCDEWGSAARKESLQIPLKEQIKTFKNLIQKKFKAKKFLIYFQAYTNSFAKLSDLQQHFKEAEQSTDVVGFVVGTRPDCVSKSVIELWDSYHKKSFLSVELGVQSFFPEHLQFLKRGHSASSIFESIKKIKQHSDVDIGIHLIFGMPNETEDQIIETAHLCNQLPITNVKLHHLHVLKNTGLETLWNQGEFKPVSLLEYAKKVELFLSHLSARIFVHRLAAFSSRYDELIAPEWSKNKMGTHQFIVDHLRSQKKFQSIDFKPETNEDLYFQQQLFKQAQPRA